MIFHKGLQLPVGNAGRNPGQNRIGIPHLQAKAFSGGADDRNADFSPAIRFLYAPFCYHNFISGMLLPEPLHPHNSVPSAHLQTSHQFRLQPS